MAFTLEDSHQVKKLKLDYQHNDRPDGERKPQQAPAIPVSSWGARRVKEAIVNILAQQTPQQNEAPWVIPPEEEKNIPA